ncbi:hypothetical protein GWI33_003037 [Rhynchophorus ferrugineus]|uniref:Uncharacterized protein n=1 Tax=Rhynchophorus ferrugineus TaxID=354439 RepID=A0A834ML01_RHYFE|nr:hypothetical protein GWI33_003037 [Rhynchophorus ferrugineus]
MATTNRFYILVVSVISGVAAIFHVLSLSTEYWVSGRIFELHSDNPKSSINYGLFKGNYARDLSTYEIYEVQMTCSFKNNICILLCGDEDYKKETLNKLISNNLRGADVDFIFPCYSTSSYSQDFLVSKKNIKSSNNNYNNVQSKYFINAAVWLCTVICLAIATFLGLTSSALSFYNIIGDGTQFYLSVGSLFFYNGLAFVFTLLYIIFWGTLYNLTIFHNVGLPDTLIGLMTSDRNAFLGYSYWISFIPLVLYGSNIGILYYRVYLNGKDSKYKTVYLEDPTNQNIYLN